MKLQIRSSKDIKTLYSTGFIQEYFFRESPSNPDYITTIEEVEDEKGERRPLKKTWEKQLNFREAVTDNVYLALEAACFCELQLIDNGDVIPIKEMSVSMDWKKDGVGVCDIRLTIDNQIIIYN